MKRILITASLAMLAAACSTEAAPNGGGSAGGSGAGEAAETTEVDLPTVEEAADAAGIDETNADEEFDSLLEEIEGDSGN